MMPHRALLYDEPAEIYAAGRHRFDTSPILEAFARFLPPGARVLNAGCGAGEPGARYFAARGDAVTGIDGSEPMPVLARRRAPQATCRRMAVRALAFLPAAFDAITAVYVLFPLPRARTRGAVFGVRAGTETGRMAVADAGDPRVHRSG